MAYAILDDDNEFICPICCCILKEPIECEKCNKSFCKKCVEAIKKNNKKNNKKDLCPFCNNEWKLIENKVFEEILYSALKFRCKKCKSCFNSQEKFDIHITKCKKYKCKICHQENEYEDYIRHLLLSHKDLVIENFNQKDNSNNNKNKGNPNNFKSVFPLGQDYQKIDYKDGEYINYWHLHNEIPKPNDELEIPNNMNLADNNLYYCGKKTNLNCGCCDGICKKGNCICVECMEFNKKVKFLSPYYLINKKARAARLDNGKFRCCYKYLNKINLNGNIMEKKTQCKFPNNPCPQCQILNKLQKKYFKE